MDLVEMVLGYGPLQLIAGGGGGVSGWLVMEKRTGSGIWWI